MEEKNPRNEMDRHHRVNAGLKNGKIMLAECEERAEKKSSTLASALSVDNRNRFTAYQLDAAEKDDAA